MRILCLHGKHQNGEVFRTRLGRLPRKLGAECVYIDGPIELDLREGDTVPLRSWFMRDAEGRPTKDSLEAALMMLYDVLDKRGPFDALLGFSQGGCMLSYLLWHTPALQSVFKMAIVVASPDCMDIEGMLNISSLHVMGETDAVVTLAESRRLASKFTRSEVLTHEKGHCLPSSAAFLDQIKVFAERQSKLVSTDVKHANSSSCVAMTSFCAEQQSEEVEVLLSIFPDLVTVEQEAPSEVGKPCARFSFQLSLDLDDPLSVKCVTLKFSMPGNYPSEDKPLVEIKSALPLSEWSPRQHRALKAVVTLTMSTCDTETCAFQIISDAIAFVANGGLDECIASNDKTEEISAEDREEVPSYSQEDIEAHIKKYTVDACHAASKAVEGRLRHTTGSGVWRYTVGLVGKPSAGKSTFFNAATRALIERNGRFAAKVSEQPFTTIDPNIATAYIPVSPRDGVQRFVPVVLKDVAGLVPGAYQGRGKGNKFLNDLCDADTIIHVCDATGSCDADGYLMANEDGEGGSTADEDCSWIRRELHLWIFGNVIEKWHSVRRHGEGKEARTRLISLFTGYQKDSKFLVELAGERAGLDLDIASEWTVLEIHRLVAFYLTIRFPICICANKVDSFKSKSEMLCSIDALKKNAFNRGETIVPCSALLDSWHVLATAKKETLCGVSEDMEAKYHAMIDVFGSTGVVETLLTAFEMNAPVLVYPVSSLDTEAPIAGTATEPLRDVVLLKPQTTIYDLFEALKRGAIDRVLLSGEFVRAEGRGIDKKSRRLQVSRDSLVGDSLCVVNIMTNRKSIWQSDYQVHN